MKKISAIALSALLLCGCSSAAKTTSDTQVAKDAHYTIGVAQLIDQTSLNTIRDAMFDEFEELGYEDGKNVTIDYQNAAGKAASLDTMMSKFAGEDADVIVAITTAAAQSAQNYTDQVPVIFSAVADPVAAGLIESYDKPAHNMTGTSFEVAVDQILDLMQEMTPDIHTIGAIYTPGEVNGVSTLNRFKEEAGKRGLEIVEATGTDLTTLQQAADSLVGKVDCFFSPNDNIVASGMTALAKTAADHGIPYYTAADSMVLDGGLATKGIDYEELGRETARMAADVLEGKSTDEIPVKVFKDDLSVYVNADTLKTLQDNCITTLKNPEDLKDADKLKMLSRQN